MLEGASVASFLSSSREDLLTFLSHVIRRPDGKSAASHDEAAICKIHLVPKPQLFALSINGNGDDSILNGENGKGDGEKERGDRARKRKKKKVWDRFDAASARKNPAIVSKPDSTIRKEGVNCRGAIRGNWRDGWRGRGDRAPKPETEERRVVSLSLILILSSVKWGVISADFC